MIINSFQGASNGRAISFENGTLSITNLTYEQAIALVQTLAPSAPTALASVTPIDGPRRTATAQAGAAQTTLANVSREETPAGLPPGSTGGGVLADAGAFASRRGPPPPRVDEAAVAAAAAASTPKPKAEKVTKEKVPGRATKAQEAAVEKAAEKPAPSPDAEVEEPDADAEPEAPADEPEPTPAKASTKTNGAATNGHAKSNGGAIADELLNAKKLKDVLAYLMDKLGITDEEDMKAKCAELKAHVPVLQRITDVDTRIKRTLEVMAAEDGADVS